jgi:hypothetical protein
MAMEENQVLKEILVMVKALTKKVDEQQEEMFKLNEKCMEQSLLIRSLTVALKHVKAPSDDIIVEKIERTLKSYAEVAKQCQVEVLEAKEEERRLANEENKNQEARVANCKLSGLEEKHEENTKEVLVSFLESQLKVHDPQIIQAYRVGKKKAEFARPIIVKFASSMEKARVVANRAMLKGQRIWLDNDLTPMQAQAKKMELEKMKAAKEQGLVAYMRNGKAFITQTKATTSK